MPHNPIASKKIDYLADWPLHYYDIQTGKMRQEFLSLAIAQKIDPICDAYRLKLCQKRFFTYSNDGSIDSFSRALTLIQAASAAGVSVFTKKRMKRELESYAKDLCLLDYSPESPEEMDILQQEWDDFSRYFISSCLGNKSYCSTLFGLVPMKDSMVSQKIALQILQVTVEYPQKFGMEELFYPLQQSMHRMYDTYFSEE